ncbi:molecular chaperone DnaJ [Oscillatoria sp. FACHB-1406]|uniref:molecular chaperone DnaJ n=1 Tax=Oscillatoria sp. FACHB-1406 TaxID=2692846 RepID=UPI0016856D7B|nr:molecular chaperone DnaJ [Oscillatoria sp. FACHB-1406]MBD2578641.1 molecular chaperone DnaJ [Oscillatoria sp. FACHB-1406]
MPRKTHATTPRPTAKTQSSLALPEVPLRLAALEEEHKKLLGLIKRKRTELTNFVEQMRTLATAVFHQGLAGLQRIAELDREIHELFDKILTERKLDKQTRKNIEIIYGNLQTLGIITHKRRERPQDEDFLDELFEQSQTEEREFKAPGSERDRQQRTFEDFQPSPAPHSKESRKIRQTFLRLAEIFHPDLVTDPETQRHHTEIMKEINTAYKQGDLARLLELEKKHKVGEKIDLNNEDSVTRRCQSLEQQNELLKQQYEQLKEELRQVRRTPEGVMVADYRRAKKEGIDAIAEMMAEVDRKREVISEVRDFVLDFYKKKLTIQRFMKGPDVLRRVARDIMEEMLDHFIEFEMGDDFEF